MKIEPISKILLSDLTASPGNVLVVPEVEVFRDNPANDVLAGICLPNADSWGMPRYVTIEFHHGRKAWHLKTEYTIQRATQWEIGILPDVIRMFEGVVGVQLPKIKVIDIGVGICSANDKYASENPWRFEDGMFYTVQDPRRGKRTFAADVRNGRTLISFVTEGGVSETFEPSVVLTEHDWRTLTPADAPSNVEKPQAATRPRM